MDVSTDGSQTIQEKSQACCRDVHLWRLKRQFSALPYSHKVAIGAEKILPSITFV